ncbi:alcohol dehydrogenase [Pontibacter oryzae]|uniref:Alcohol dehydrogenase n=1 Tax=Pontibacter oryzae TaxID=2304593 RepID=A0A399S377_9BACT|nr:alcohol dehydrogenase [Pontibacter oryzae]RIJ37768.1 alcohol dehydrogenase [Pontibacter oryzae]
MKAVQVKSPGGPFEVVEKPVPTPADNEVLIKVQACGICHSDAMVKDGTFPGIDYPRVPGHEVVGIVEKVGANVMQWEVNQRVGVGWHGGHCFECEQCRRGDFVLCEKGKVCGISYDGGYAEYMVAPEEAIASIPDDLSSAEAAPLLCAGITVFNSLRNSGVRPGGIVAVQGIGGLGHLAVQYAKKMGFYTVAISGTNSKHDLAMELGADVFLNEQDHNVVEELQKLGGADIIMATAPNSDAISSLIDGLAINGKLMALAATVDPVKVTPLQLIMGRKSITGWPSGTAKDSEDTLKFSARSKTVPMIETYPLEKAEEAYEQMITNKARFRVVLTME